MLRLAPGNLGRSPSAEKHANIGDFIPRGRPRHILGCVLKCSLRGTRLCFEKTLEDLHRSPSAEKTPPHCVGHGGPRGFEHSRQSRESPGGNWPPLRGYDGHLSPPGVADYPVPSGLSDSSGGKIFAVSRQRDLSSVFRTDGDIDTPLSSSSSGWLRFSSRLLLGQHAACRASHRLVQGWVSDVIAEDSNMFCKCSFPVMWIRLGVATPGDAQAHDGHLSSTWYGLTSLLRQRDTSTWCWPWKSARV